MATVSCTKHLGMDVAHRVMSHDGKCRFLHGHRYTIEVTATAPQVPDSGMLVDFGVLGAHLRLLVHDVLDHATVLAADDPLLPLLVEAGQRVVPLASHPTAENLAAWVARRLTGPLSGHGVQLTQVVVHETPTSRATWTA